MKRIGFCALCLLLSFGAWAAPFSNLFVFGDSLSDTGNVLIASGGRQPVSPPYFQGRFSNGPIYADYLAAQLGVPLSPSLAGGNNFAVGAARTDSSPVGPSFDFLGQVGTFRSRFPMADPGALYVVFIGSNNIRDALGAAAANPSDAQLIAAQAVTNAVGDIAQGLGTLAGAGARSFLVVNLPDVGATPAVRESGSPQAAGFARATASAFNTALDAVLGAFVGLDIDRLDSFGLFDAARANPGAFGFTNVTDRCYTGSESSFNGTVCANPDQYLFWDAIHPSGRAHALLGAAAIAAVVPVPEPAVVVLLATGLLGALLSRRVSSAAPRSRA